MPDHTLDEAKTILWHVSLIYTLYLYTAPPRDHVMGGRLQCKTMCGEGRWSASSNQPPFHVVAK